MGRHIMEATTGEWVWKYAVGEQHSEQSRIVTELNVGRLSCNEYGDTVEIEREELPRLERWLKDKLRLIREWGRINRKLCPDGWLRSGSQEEKERAQLLNSEKFRDIHFICMVKVFCDFIKKHEYIQSFRFEGEY